MWPNLLCRYGSSCNVGSLETAGATSAAIDAASCCGDFDDGPTMRSVSQRNTTIWTRSTTASRVMNPNAMRQYRLRYHTGSDIGELVARTPHGQDEAGLGPVVLDLAAHALDQRVHTPIGDVRVTAPHPLHQRFTAEHDAGIAGQQIQQIEFVRGQLDVAPFEFG